MVVVSVLVTAVTAALTAATAAADLRRAGFVMANSAEVGVPVSWLPVLAALKAAGAAGLLLGLLGVAADVALLRWSGVAAATGLVLFFTGALVTHVRARVFHNIAFPGCFWLLALASLVLAVGQL